jgi:hypothetical protein
MIIFFDVLDLMRVVALPETSMKFSLSKAASVTWQSC